MTLDLRFPSDPRLLQIVRSVVGQMSALCGFEDEETQFIVLAVDEACANIIRHSYCGRADGEIRLTCAARDERIEFVLVDWGRAPCEPGRLQPRSLEEVRPGGLGMHLIQSIMDEVRYRFGERENELYLAKSLPRRKIHSGVVTE